MPWQLSLFTLLGFGSAALCTGIALLSWQYRRERGSRPFQWLMIALAGWSLAYGTQLLNPTLPAQLFWQRIGLAIGGTIPTLWLIFTLQYAGFDDRLSRSVRALLLVDPLVFALLTLTNPSHHLVWSTSTLTQSGAGSVAFLTLELGYFIHIGYAYVLIVVGLALLVNVFQHTSLVYQRQTGFLILGAIPPFLANIAFSLRVSWGPLPAVDLTPIAFALTGLIFALALFRFDLLDRTPIARQRVLDEMGDGLVVADADGKIVNTNDVARQAFDRAPTVGDSIEQISGGAESPDAAAEYLDGRTIDATVNDRERSYDLDWSSLTDHHDAVVGHVLALRDITDRAEYEQRLEVAQRVLRHNLRNEMSVVRGWAEHIVEGNANGTEPAAQRIIDSADELIDLSEKTQTMVRLEGAGVDDHMLVSVHDHVHDLVQRFRSAHPDAVIEYEPVPSAVIPLPDEDFLEIPVRNLIENAIEHNESANPWLRVRTETSGDRVIVHIEDNGPEIPAMERKALDRTTRDQLTHGSGVGLWLTYWSVRTAGGSVRFDTREPTGNVVTIEFSAQP